MQKKSSESITFVAPDELSELKHTPQGNRNGREGSQRQGRSRPVGTRQCTIYYILNRQTIEGNSTSRSYLNDQ